MDVETTFVMTSQENVIPCHARCCFNVKSTRFERYGRQKGIKTTLCALP